MDPSSPLPERGGPPPLGSILNGDEPGDANPQVAPASLEIDPALLTDPGTSIALPATGSIDPDIALEQLARVSDVEAFPHVDHLLATTFSEQDLATALANAEENDLARVTSAVEMTPSGPIAAGPSSSFGNRPPYVPPRHVIYPSDSFPNPHIGDLSDQPVFANLPAGSLYRPAFLPSDIDPRISKSSVWMGVEKHTANAIYFLPPTCRGCTNPAVAQFCDRTWPTCSRCVHKQMKCVRGATWGVMRPRGKRRAKRDVDDEEDGVVNFDTSDMGKGKAPATLQSVLSTPDSGGRGQRVKKKRRLSAGGELDPNDIDDDGVVVVNKPMKRASKPSMPLFRDEPMWLAQDAEYRRRVEENHNRPPLSNMRGQCPIWSNSRRALMAACEYFRQPVKTEGASVEIGINGIARGVILEGEAPGLSETTYFGEMEDVGTIVVSIGLLRPLHGRDSSPSQGLGSARSTPTPLPAVGTACPTASEPPLRPATGRETALSPILDETPVVRSLLAAQEAGTPIAIALSEDYSAAPFKVPRRFIVLGWFFVTEAWLEPDVKDFRDAHSFWSARRAGKETFGRWKFRFDWATQPAPGAGLPGVMDAQPWWASKEDSRRAQMVSFLDHSHSEDIYKPNGSTGGMTVKRNSVKTSYESHAFRCHVCMSVSRLVFNRADMCLDERCRDFFKEVPRDDGTVLPYELARSELFRYAPSREKRAYGNRIFPESLGLRLRPPRPVGSIQDSHVSREQAGREFWRPWVCEWCGMANERTDWSGWKCEACDREIKPKRHIFDSSSLRPPTRPVYTGPRQDQGYPSWTFPSSTAWQLFDDGTKVMQHGVEAGLGMGAKVYHSLSSQSARADEVLLRLQRQGDSEIGFKRRRLAPRGKSQEPSLSSFYTQLWGRNEPQSTEDFPTGPPVDWKEYAAVGLGVIDLINDMSGRMFPGQMERFNSLLIAVFPPELPKNLTPTITIAPHTYISLMFIGSDGGVRLHSYDGNKRTKAGELTTLHGDTVGIKSGARAIDVSPSLDGFGFLCIARQAYNVDDIPMPTLAGAETERVDGRTKGARARPRASIIMPSQARPKPKLLSAAPLTNWYIGTRPLDSSQPLRVRAPLRQRDANPIIEVIIPETADTANINKPAVPPLPIQPDAAAIGGEVGAVEEDVGIENVQPAAEWNGREIVGTPPPGEVIRPPPVSPMGKKKKKLDVDAEPDQPKKKPRKKSEKGAKVASREPATGTPSTIA